MDNESDPIYQRLRGYLASDMPNAKGWYDAHCPLHDDDKRSAGFNFERGIWSCRANCGSGDIGELVRRLDARADNDFVPADFFENTPNSPFLDMDDAEIIDLQTRRRAKRRQNREAPTQADLDAWQSRLFGDKELLSKFQARRGINSETLKRFEIGYSDDDRAYTIPIKDPDGILLNVRLYRIEEQETKIWSYGSPGMDANAIFPEIILKENQQVVIAEGEWDALVAIQEGFPAVSGTTGAMQWQQKWNRKFNGKDVLFCYDRDKAGDEGAAKGARSIAGLARSVKIIKLPLEWREKNGLDITDFFHNGAHTPKDFRLAMKEAEEFAASKDGRPIEVSVKESFSPELSGKPMAMVVSVVGKSTSQHLLPRVVNFSCGMNADKLCAGCPMFDANGAIEHEIAYSDPIVLRLREVPERVRDEALREHLGAHKCGKMESYVKEWMTTEMLVVRSSIDHTDDEGDTGSRTVISVGRYATEANRVVNVIGTTYPSPKEQESVFQAWDLDQVESSLDTYEVTGDDIERMKVFRPSRHQTPLKKMGDIARDLSENVTHIVGEERVDLHIAMDLVWHSVIKFEFGGQTIDRGWLELLVIGDARTGKSKVATDLSRHYGLGRVVSCESASIPGLLGAVKPMPGGKNWTLEWGAIPLNDRRLVVMDEAGGLTPEQISQLSSVRSSGKAEIIKAASEVTNARTRLIWLSNPRRNEKGMGDYMYGIRAIQPLIGNQEDIARFDFAMSVGGDDVPLDEINRRIDSNRTHRYTAEACNALLRWVWSRKSEDVIWERDAEQLVYDHSMALGEEFVPDPPLIQGQNVRQKIARLSVAVAARVFSTDDTYHKLVVKEEHVTSAVKFLRWIYGRPSFGYAEVSKRAKDEERAAIARLDEVKQYLYSRPGLARFLIGCQGLFRRQQMEEMLNYSREEANLVIQKLAAMSMIRSNSDWDYRIMPYMNVILRETN